MAEETGMPLEVRGSLREVKVYLPSALFEAMMRQAADCGCSQSGYVRRLIAQDVLNSARMREHRTDMDT